MCEVCDILSPCQSNLRKSGDGAGNTVEENSGVISLIQVC